MATKFHGIQTQLHKYAKQLHIRKKKLEQGKHAVIPLSRCFWKSKWTGCRPFCSRHIFKQVIQAKGEGSDTFRELSPKRAECYLPEMTPPCTWLSLLQRGVVLLRSKWPALADPTMASSPSPRISHEFGAAVHIRLLTFLMRFSKIWTVCFLLTYNTFQFHKSD